MRAIVFMRQVHGAEVAYVSEPFGEDAPPVDGVYTTEPGLALASSARDCPAVLVADPVARMVGAARSGRPGTEAGVAAALVAAMADKGRTRTGWPRYRPRSLRAAATRSPPSYAPKWPPRSRNSSSTTSWNTPALDLRAGIEAPTPRSGRTRRPARRPLHTGIRRPLLPPPQIPGPLRGPHLACAQPDPEAAPDAGPLPGPGPARRVTGGGTHPPEYGRRQRLAWSGVEVRTPAGPRALRAPTWLNCGGRCHCFAQI